MANEKQPTSFQAPTWLDAAFIQEALHHGGEITVKVKDVSVQPASKAGDNYGSTLYRVKARLAGGGVRCFIVKTLPPGDMAQHVTEAGLFRIEKAMFGRIVPEMEALIAAAAPKRFAPMSPRCFHFGSHPADFLVMEDLREKGFDMVDRHKGLGLRHSLIALRTIARFHATSAALLQKDPKAADGLPNVFKLKSNAMEVFTHQGLQSAAIACKSWPGYEEYVPLLNSFKLVALDIYDKFHDLNPKSFNVILHGDCWMNNMMIRYEDGLPQEVRVFDLQISREGPAVLDVLYFLNCSISEDVSKNHQDMLLREYHVALVEAMELLGLQPPSLDTILSDLNSYGAYALFGGLNVLPLTKAKRVPNMDALMEGDAEAVRFLYEDPVVKRWLQRIIPEYRRKGWLPG